MHILQVGFAIVKNVYGPGLILRAVPSFVRNPGCVSLFCLYYTGTLVDIGVFFLQKLKRFYCIKNESAFRLK